MMTARILFALIIGGFCGAASAIELASGVEGTLSAQDGQLVLTVKNAARVDVQVDNIDVLLAVQPGAHQSEVVVSKVVKQHVAAGNSVGVSLMSVESLVAKMRSVGEDIPNGPLSLIAIENSPNGCSSCEARSKAQWIRPFGVQSVIRVGDVKASSLFGGYVTFVRYY